MKCCRTGSGVSPVRWSAGICAVLLLAACSLKAGKGPEAICPPCAERIEVREPERPAPPVMEQRVADLSRIPQKLDSLSAAARDRLALPAFCQDQLHSDFITRFYAPWKVTDSNFDAAEARDFMKHEGRATWYGVNKRRVPPKQMQELIANCDLQGFPSRDETAIAAVPGHLRGLPTQQPLFSSPDDFPFDMLSYPQLKLNEPLRVRHSSKDGVWLFVETATSNGWVDRRDVALVDGAFIDSWMQAPHLVITRDYTPVPDGKGTGAFRAKIGTILPLAGEGEGEWEVAVASAGEGGRVDSRIVKLPREVAAPFPLVFTPDQVALIGNQFLGEPYGWGESYDLRDCSAMLRDFFLPFGIWLPRTSADQIDSLPKRIVLARKSPDEKEELIRRDAIPFLTLFYKPGHIMLYLGEDKEGRPLVMHDAWSIRLQGQEPKAGSVREGSAAVKGEGEVAACPEGCAESQGPSTMILGTAAITTLEPGKELGLVPGSSLLERLTELGTITSRCQESKPGSPPK